MPDLEEVKGLSEARADKFREAGFTTVDDIATAEPADLAEIKGIGESTAGGIRDSARDVLRDTVSEADDDSDEEVNTEPPEPDVDNSVPDVEDRSDFEVDAATAEVEAGDDADDEEDPETENEGPPYEFTIALESDEEYDYLHYSLMNIRHGQAIASADKAQKCEEMLDKIRDLGGAGEITLEADVAGLNGLHSALVQTRSNYQGVNDEAYLTLDIIIEQVNEARDQFR